MTIITLEFSLSNVGNRENIVTRAPFMIVASIVGTNLHLGLKRNMQYSFLQKCNTFSLSKCLKYPGFIFLCPQKLSKKNPRKKPKSLNYPNTIPEFFSEFGYVQDFFYVPRTIRGKKTNTLNYPNSILYFRDLAKFSWILHENKRFCNLCLFCKNLAMFNSVL